MNLAPALATSFPLAQMVRDFTDADRAFGDALATLEPLRATTGGDDPAARVGAQRDILGRAAEQAARGVELLERATRTYAKTDVGTYPAPRILERLEDVEGIIESVTPTLLKFAAQPVVSPVDAALYGGQLAAAKVLIASSREDAQTALDLLALG